jgi:hypothetical protein
MKNPLQGFKNLSRPRKVGLPEKLDPAACR